MTPRSLVLAAFLTVVVSAVGTEAVTVRASGQVPCRNGTSIDAAAAPPFTSATVQVMCGGSVVASAITDGNGSFVADVAGDVLNQGLITALLGNLCKAEVVTPLAACNASLADAGPLTAPLLILDSAAAGSVRDIASSLLGNQVISTILGDIIGVVTGLFSST